MHYQNCKIVKSKNYLVIYLHIPSINTRTNAHSLKKRGTCNYIVSAKNRDFNMLVRTPLTHDPCTRTGMSYCFPLCHHKLCHISPLIFAVNKCVKCTITTVDGLPPVGTSGRCRAAFYLPPFSFHKRFSETGFLLDF